MTPRNITSASPAALPVRVALTCAALLWIVPFVQPLAAKPMLHFFHEWFAALLGLGVCVVLARPAPRPGEAPTLTVIGLLALAVMLALQPLWLQLPWWQPTFVQVVMTIWFAALVAAGARLRDLVGVAVVVDVLAAGAAIGGGLAALAGIIQWFAPPDLLAALVPRTGPVAATNLMGLIRHQSWLADHLVLGTVGVAWLAGRRRLPAIAALPALVIIAIPLSISGSRASLLQFAVLLGLALIALRLRRDDSGLARSGAWLAIAALLYLVAVVGGASWWSASGSTAARLAESGHASGFASRTELWRRAVEAIAMAPLAGHGTDGYAWAAFRIATGGAVEEYTIHAHNLLLHAGVTGGIPAMACVIAVLVAVIIGAWRAWQAREPWLPAAMVAVILVRSLVDLPTAFAFFAAPTALLVGLLPVPRWTLPRRLRIPAPAIAMALIAGLSLAGHTLWSYLEFTGLWSAAESTSRRNERLGRAASNPFLAAVAGSVSIDAARLDRPKVASLLAASSRTVRWRPYPHATFRHGLLLALAERPADSCRWLTHAVRVYPKGTRKFVDGFDRRDADPAILRMVDWMRDPGAACDSPRGSVGLAVPPLRDRARPYPPAHGDPDGATSR